MTKPPTIGDVLVVEFPGHYPPGHEQEGLRPALVVGDPILLGNPRYPTLIVVPLTSQIGKWVTDSPNLYPVLPVGSGNLNKESVVRLDNIRAIDASRVKRRIGSLTVKEYQPIKGALKIIQALE